MMRQARTEPFGSIHMTPVQDAKGARAGMIDSGSHDPDDRLRSMAQHTL